MTTLSGHWQSRDLRDTGIIRGVCARVAERAGVPVWMPRAAFVIFGILHWLLAIIAYWALTKAMHLGRRRPAPVLTPEPPQASAVRDRFSALDARLAAMEAASLEQESHLRRAFRDLERT